MKTYGLVRQFCKGTGLFFESYSSKLLLLDSFRKIDDNQGMITEQEKTIIRGISQRYKPQKVLLFGSALISNKTSNDIDVAVEGIDDKDFFSFYGDLIFALNKPVDVIDLKNDTKFNRLVRQTGTVIYE